MRNQQDRCIYNIPFFSKKNNFEINFFRKLIPNHIFRKKNVKKKKLVNKKWQNFVHMFTYFQKKSKSLNLGLNQIFRKIFKKL